MGILDANEHPDIISWLPHGRGFVIRDKRRLAETVLPKYFKESKYTSFTRRLNRWNFTIQTHGHKEASYFHPVFVQGDPQRALEMHPTPQSSNSKRESRYFDQNQRLALGMHPDAPMMDGIHPGSMPPGGQRVQHGHGHGMPMDNAMDQMRVSMAGSGVDPLAAAQNGQGHELGREYGGDGYRSSPSGGNGMPSLSQQQGSMQPNNASGGHHHAPMPPQMQSFQMQGPQQQMQTQFYGQPHSMQAPRSMQGTHPMHGSTNPMYGTQAHHRANMTRDMIYSHQAAMYPPQHQHYQQAQGMGQNTNTGQNMGGPGMVTIIHPQLGPTMVQQQPQMGMSQPQYQEYPQQNRHHQQNQYAPVTSTSRPRAQVMYPGGDQMQMAHMPGQQMQHSPPAHPLMGSQYHDMNSSSSSGMSSSQDPGRKSKGMVPVIDGARKKYPPQRTLLKKSKVRPESDTQTGHLEEQATLKDTRKKEEVSKKKDAAPSLPYPSMKETNVMQTENARGTERKEESKGNRATSPSSETKSPPKSFGMADSHNSQHQRNVDKGLPESNSTDGSLEGENAKKRSAKESDPESTSEPASKKATTTVI
jgi:hypothetical protein